MTTVTKYDKQKRIRERIRELRERIRELKDTLNESGLEPWERMMLTRELHLLLWELRQEETVS